MKQFKEFLNEIKLSEANEVEVSVRDARKANDIASDMFRGEYKMDGSNVFVFKKKSSKEEFIDELESQGIEVLEESTLMESNSDNMAKFLELNKDRVGKTAINLKGNENKNSILIQINETGYIIAYKDSNNYIIHAKDVIFQINDRISLTKEQFDILKKLK